MLVQGVPVGDIIAVLLGQPGTQFLREWQGRTHVVTVNDDGDFVYQGTDYRSLSKVARAITGTRWSGPAFFGLTGSGVKSDG